jgi:hypothetical protein
VSDESEILLIGDVCEHCGALAFKAESGQIVHNYCSFHSLFHP